jgi:hypothetical protein
MERVCFIENRYYSKKYFEEELKRDRKFINSFIRELRKRNIIKLVKKKNKEDNSKDTIDYVIDSIDDDSTNNNYKFSYVGLIIYEDILLIIAPKYKKGLLEKKEQDQLIKLFKEYSLREKLNVEESEFLGHSGLNNDKSNILGIIDYLLEDYTENGLYINDEAKIGINGSGVVDWDKTIERNNVFWSKSMQPIYIETITKRLENNKHLIITQIHKYVLSKCISLLEDLGVREIFGYDDIEFDIQDLFEDNDEIIYYLENELDVQFIDRKISIIEAMISFIKKQSSDSEDCEIQFYGTRYFHIVWEKILGYILSNQYEEFKKYIPKPIWLDYENSKKDDEGEVKENIKSTFIPDILIEDKENDRFMILDAKYYNFNFNSDGELIGNPPGIEDIMKQLAYESIFNKNFKNIENIFLVPSNEETKIIGVVRLELFGTKGEIKVIGINAEYVYDKFINNVRYNGAMIINKIMKKKI